MKTMHIASATILVWGFIVAARIEAAPPQQPAALEQRAVRSAVVTTVTSAITVDGVLDETAWGASPKIGELIQLQNQRVLGRNEVSYVFILE
jgi:hypothetical protein